MSVTCAVRQMFHDDQIDENKMGRIYGTHERPREMRTEFQARSIILQTCARAYISTDQYI
jgi:hypothetical protein